MNKMSVSAKFKGIGFVKGAVTFVTAAILFLTLFIRPVFPLDIVQIRDGYDWVNGWTDEDYDEIWGVKLSSATAWYNTHDGELYAGAIIIEPLLASATAKARFEYSFTHTDPSGFYGIYGEYRLTASGLYGGLTQCWYKLRVIIYNSSQGNQKVYDEVILEKSLGILDATWWETKNRRNFQMGNKVYLVENDSFKIQILAVAKVGTLGAIGHISARVDFDEFNIWDCDDLIQGDPALYAGFGEDQDAMAGDIVQWTLQPANLGGDVDTFCVFVYDTKGWVITADPPLGECKVINPDNLWYQDIFLSIPCDDESTHVNPGDKDTIYAVMTYCAEGTCVPGCDYTDPTNWGGEDYYSTDMVIVTIVQSTPKLEIINDSLSTVWQGQGAGYIPFSICNADICSESMSFVYEITNQGYIGDPFLQSGTVTVAGGDCEHFYCTIDASSAPPCTYDTLTIIAWDTLAGTEYDTSVQIVHVIEPLAVPLLTSHVIPLLVLTLLLTSIVMIKLRAIK
jgi:hypothetical protein